MNYILARKLAGELVCGIASASVRLAGRNSGDLFGLSLARGPADQPSIALTFDDGPSEGTERVLETLDRHKIPAAFFVCGSNVRRLPELTRAIAAAGHEIGNHTDSHSDLWFRSHSVIRRELLRTQEAVQDAACIRPQLFRPTFGSRWFGLKDVLEEMNLLRVMWDTGGDDWNSNGNHTANKIIAAANHGSIICLHDGRGVLKQPDIQSTLDALNLLIPVLLDRGLQFQSLAALLHLSDDATNA